MLEASVLLNVANETVQVANVRALFQIIIIIECTIFNNKLKGNWIEIDRQSFSISVKWEHHQWLQIPWALQFLFNLPKMLATHIMFTQKSNCYLISNDNNNSPPLIQIKMFSIAFVSWIHAI